MIMKLKHFLLILPVCLLSLACRQEVEYAEDPVYESMFFSADSIDFGAPIATKVAFDAGQEVYVGIAFADGGGGKNIMRATQAWSVLSASGEVVLKDSKMVVGAAGKEPSWSFKAPLEAGTYTVTFKEKYSYSVQKITGQIFGESRTVSASFKVK